MLKFLRLLIAILLPSLAAGCVALPDLEQLEQPHYQQGSQEGAAYCATCHPDTYEQWSNHSRHALATRSSAFHAALGEIRTNPVLGEFMTDAMCYACHGNPKRNEGINCESCHGPVLKGVPIEVTHEKKYKPRLEEMRKGDFCARCHEASMPVTNEPLTTVHSEWKASPAAKRGQTCQSCHMPKEDGSYAYHGFNTLVRNPGLYRNQLVLSHLTEAAGNIHVTIENRVTGHAIPAAGPTRVLALTLELKDRSGHTVHSETRRFFKHFSMAPLVGGVPFTLIENSQLQAGEKRRLHFALPPALRGTAREAVFELRMYEVADKHEGDIARAHWRSAPITVRRKRLR